MIRYPAARSFDLLEQVGGDEGVLRQLEFADDVSGHPVTRRRNRGRALAAFQMSQDLGSIERVTGVTADPGTSSAASAGCVHIGGSDSFPSSGGAP